MHLSIIIYSFPSHIRCILRFNSIKTLLADAVTTTDGIIRFNTDAGATNIEISSSGRLSAYGSSPSGTTSDSTCLDAAYTASLSPADASSSCFYVDLD